MSIPTHFVTLFRDKLTRPQLLVGIFEFTQIPTSQALLKHLAEMIGEGTFYLFYSSP